MIIVVTHSQDLTADFVIRHFVQQRIDFLRLDTDTLSSPQRHFAFDGGSPTLKYDAITITSDRVSAVWARRFARPQSLDNIAAPYSRFAQRELRDVMEAFIDSVHGLVANTYEADRKAGNRLTQAIAAAQVGFVVPQTLVTQNHQEALRFVTGRRSMAKAISFGVLTDDGGRVAHTTPVTAGEFEGLDSCPVLLQEEISKRREWRVTTVGSRVFAARTRDGVEIDKNDWRRSADLKSVFELATLPAEITSRLLALCKSSDIHFGAHDLIETPDGTFVFLETNPAGQWGWLELTLGVPIGEAIASLLIQRDPTV